MADSEFSPKGAESAKSQAGRCDGSRFPTWLQDELAAAEQDLAQNGPVSQDELENKLGLLFEDLARDASAGRLKP